MRSKKSLEALITVTTLLAMLLLPLVFTIWLVEATSPDYTYLQKIDRDLIKYMANNGQELTVDAIIVAAKDLNAVRRLVSSYGGIIRISLDTINSLAVTLPISRVESIAKSSSVMKVWFDHKVTLNPQADISNIKAELLRGLASKISEKKENIEKTVEEAAYCEGLNPELYEIPKDGIISLLKTKEDEIISWLQVELGAVSPETYFTYQVGAEKLWAMGYTGAGTYIAVLDVGATASHPMLAGAVVGGYSEVPGEPEWDHPNALHGTMTASMAVGRPVVAVMAAGAAFARAVARWFPEKIIPPGTYPWGTIPPGYVGIAFIGEAPGAWLWVGKVLTYDGSGMLSWILAGMQRVIYLRRYTPIHVDVVSMSLGVRAPWSAVNDGTDPWSLMVNALVAEGITVVQSAGNAGPGAFTISQSAVAEKNIGVGGYVYARMFKTYLDWYSWGYSAYARMPDDDEMIWYFASRGPTRDYRTGVAVVAPCAYTIGAGGYYGLYWGSGTSFSAPRVAGEALLLIQYYRTKKGTYPTPEIVRAAIVVGADYLADYSHIEQGGGRWNPYKASQLILNPNIVGRARRILDASYYHNIRVGNQITFTAGVSEYTLASLGIERYARFYFNLTDPDMYRITITNIVETYSGMNTLYIWVFDPKGDLANIGMAWRSGGTILNYGQIGYYYYLIGETQYSGVYKWNQYWAPNDPGIWEVVIENDFFSWEPVGFTIRVEKSEVTMTASADKVTLKNRGVDIGLSAPGGLKAYEGYMGSISGSVRNGQVWAATFNVLPDTTELLVILDWDDNYFDQFPADLDLYLIDPLGNWWVAYDPPLTPMGIFGGTVNIPETCYFGDYTQANIVPGTWTVIVHGYKVTPATAKESFKLSVEGKIRDVTRPTKVYNVDSLDFFFEELAIPVTVCSGDDVFGTYTLPFSFPFYDGRDYTTIYVGSNGYITFTAGSTVYSDSAIWSLFTTSPTLAVMAMDLVTTAYAIPHDNYVTILWWGRAFGEPAGTERGLMLAQLYNNGDIVVSYNDWIRGLAGVSKGDGITYITISPADMTAFQFTYSYTTLIIETYTYAVGSVPYFWETGGVSIFSGDDVFGTYTLPFSFPFYGVSYSTIYVGSNGYITFDKGYTVWSDSAIWDLFRTKPTIAPMATDLVTTGYVIVGPNYVTIRWHGRAYGEPTGAVRDLMLVRLYDNGDIVMSYADWIRGLGTRGAGVSKGDGATWTIITPADYTATEFKYERITTAIKIVSYTVSSVPFIWEPIIAPIVSGDDAFAAYTLPFDFPFCGTTYRTAYVGTNGYITFDRGYTVYSDSTILSMFTTAPTISVMGMDLVTSVYVVPHDNYVTILWWGRAFGEPAGTERWLMMAQLYDNGNIIMSYKDWIRGLAGVSDGDGFNYVLISPSDYTTFEVTVAAIIPAAVVFENPNPWLPADSVVEVYYTENVPGKYIFSAKHYWVEKFFRDGGVYAWIYGRFLYENAQAYH